MEKTRLWLQSNEQQERLQRNISLLVGKGMIESEKSFCQEVGIYPKTFKVKSKIKFKENETLLAFLASSDDIYTSSCSTDNLSEHTSFPIEKDYDYCFFGYLQSEVGF